MGTAPSTPTDSDDLQLSLNEWVTLALLAEMPRHGFALSRELAPASDLGRVLTVHRPLVYRALDRLVAAGLAEPHQTEPGDGGPTRTLHRPTTTGRAAIDRWLDRPVGHIRDLRIEFVVKVRLNRRRDRDLEPLVSAQQTELADTAAGLTAEPPTATDDDVVDLWRRHHAAAAMSFLDELADRVTTR